MIPKPSPEARYVRRVMARQRHGQGEWVHLDCGHRWLMPIADTATAYKCRFCVREDTGYDPPGDPAPAKISVVEFNEKFALPESGEPRRLITQADVDDAVVQYKNGKAKS